MTTLARRGGAFLAVGVLLIGLLASSLAGTFAYFSHRTDGSVTLSTGEVAIVSTLDQLYDGLLPGVEKSTDLSYTNDSTDLVDVYMWIEQVVMPDDFDFCTVDRAPYLQIRLATPAEPLLDWTSYCNVLQVGATVGAAAPVLLAEDVAPNATQDFTVAVRLHASAGEEFEDVANTGDRFVLYAIQAGAPAPDLGTAGPPVPGPTSVTVEAATDVESESVLEGLDESAEGADDSSGADEVGGSGEPGEGEEPAGDESGAAATETPEPPEPSPSDELPPSPSDELPPPPLPTEDEPGDA